MVLEQDVFDYIQGDATYFEREPLEKLSRTASSASTALWVLAVHGHAKGQKALWNPLRNGHAKWKVWED
jgi:glucose-1-phosphate cytidylyltransferase